MQYLVVIRGSTSELQCVFPLIAAIKQKFPESAFAFYFTKGALYKRVLHNPSYAALLRQYASVSFTNKLYLICFLLFNRMGIDAVLVDHCNLTKVIPVLRKVLYKAKFILFPHAYGFLYIEPNKTHGDSIIWDPIEFETMNQEPFHGADVLILNTHLEANYYKNYYSGKVLISGALGLAPDWQEKLSRISGSNHPIIQTMKGYEGMVFVAIRRPGKHQDFYINEENYAYQTRALVSLASEKRHFLFVIKPHPRHKKKGDPGYRWIEEANLRNLIVSHESSFFLARQAVVTISFLSSTVMDSIAAGTPCIEFHRYHTANSQLVKLAKGGYISLYSYLNICRYVDSEEQLRLAFDEVIENRGEILRQQKTNMFANLDIDDKVIGKFLDDFAEVTKSV